MSKYSDLNLNFVKHPNTRDVIKRYDIEAVKASVLHLIRTNHGEKLFKPNFGGDLKSLLFEPVTSVSSELLKRKWNEMFLMYEPRALIRNLTVTTENAELYIVLEVELVGKPNITFTIPLSVERIR